ncbi:MAG: polysaccharide deacetylase family protein [Pseudomonadota bacterium]
MRNSATILLVSTLLFVAATVGAAACEGKLGVSRTLKIDASGGPLYGSVQYKSRSPLEDGEVVITFDDGPLRTNTRRVLKALKDHCTKATFFMVGRMAVADPAMVREVAAQGHTIASHTWTHKNLKRWSQGRAKGEIELGISAIEKALGKPIAPFFRFPYLSDPNSMIEYLQERDLAIFSIDVDSYDYRTRSGDSVRRTIMRQLASRGKGILLFHDIQISTVRAMPSLLNDLHRKGFKVVHIVAGSSTPTLAAYDKQAEELHANRRYSTKIRPIGSPSDEKRTRKSKKATKTAQANQPTNQSSTAPRKKKATPPKPASDWRRQVLGN